MPKLLRAVLVLVVAAFAASGTVVATAATQSAHRTAVRKFEPFTASGAIASGYTVQSTAKGHCWTNSASTTRADAFRCFEGSNFILDPCFKNAAGTEVGCPVASFHPEIVLLHLTKPLPEAHASGHPSAWRLVIKGGATCDFLTGATYIVHGNRANFGCSNRLTLFGHAVKKHEPWTIRAGRGLHPKLHWVTVSKAWF